MTFDNVNSSWSCLNYVTSKIYLWKICTVGLILFYAFVLSVVVLKLEYAEEFLLERLKALLGGPNGQSVSDVVGPGCETENLQY